MCLSCGINIKGFIQTSTFRAFTEGLPPVALSTDSCEEDRRAGWCWGAMLLQNVPRLYTGGKHPLIGVEQTNALNTRAS